MSHFPGQLPDLEANDANLDLRAPAAAANCEPESAGNATLLQRLLHMTVPERVKTALSGTSEERLFLIRDQNRMVQRAVIQSPQTGEREAEAIAAMGNVGEEALRLLASERRFRRSPRLLLLLALNPHCPLDVTLEIYKHLGNADLQKLVRNRTLSEPARRAADRELRRRHGK